MRGTTGIANLQHCHPCTSLSGGDTMWYYYPRGPVCVAATAIASTELTTTGGGLNLNPKVLART